LYIYLRYFLHYAFFAKGCFQLGFLKNETLRPFLETVFRFYFVSIGYPEYLRSLRRGLQTGEDFFACAVKPAIKSQGSTSDY